MEQLSIEEKVKRYDEALEKAKRELQACGSLDCDAARQIFRFFPELAESEEEKIKKAIGYAIGQSTHSDGTLINGVSSEEALAWLEKQAKQKPADKIESRQEELTEFEKAVKQVMEETIECGDTHNLKADADMLLRLVQKPAWSEEDDTFFKAIIRDIENTQYISEDAKKDRINWLKSLRPQNRWKPSDEQIYSLDRALRFYGKGTAVYDSVKGLLEQLKKLKG